MDSELGRTRTGETIFIIEALVYCDKRVPIVQGREKLSNTWHPDLSRPDESDVRRPELKKNWVPTQGAFQKFLKWLDEGVDSDGERYLEMRRRLIAYFDRKNCSGPEDLADDTLTRVAQKLDEKGDITGMSPAHYCYVVAKFVFLEYLRRPEQSQASLDDPNASLHPIAGASSEPEALAQERLECLELCLRKLPSGDRELIMDYYQGELRAKIERRAKLAERLGVTTNALSIRACRIRQRLEVCVRRCCNQV